VYCWCFVRLRLCSTFDHSLLGDVAGFGQQEARETWQLLDLLPPNTYAELLAAVMD
jgi:hypothetical protein